MQEAALDKWDEPDSEVCGLVDCLCCPVLALDSLATYPPLTLYYIIDFVDLSNDPRFTIDAPYLLR